MKINDRIFTVTTLLVAAAVATGAFVRFANLGQNPLDVNEATLALQALSSANGNSSAWSGHPLFLELTTILFYFCGATDFIARLVPALFGTALLLLPVLFRKQLRPGVMILMTWILALDPSLIAASRTAGSWMISLALLGFLLAAVFYHRTWTTAVLLALTLLSGPTLWPVLLLIGLSLFLWIKIFPDQTLTRRFTEFNLPRQFWFVLGVSFVGIAGLTFLLPNGLSSFGGSFIDFGRLLVTTEPASLLLVVLALPLYTPVVFFTGFVQGIRSVKLREPISILAFLYILVVSLVLIALPGRQPLMVTWMIVPLAYLAATAIAEILSYAAVDYKQPMLIAGFVVLILVFISQVIGSFNQGRLEVNQFLLYFGGGLVILLVCAILAILGWSLKVTGIGYGWGFLLVFSLYTVAAAWHSAGIVSRPNIEFWNFGETPSQVELVEKTIGDVSSPVRGVKNGLDIYALGEISPALEWQLRNQTFYTTMSISYLNPPALVISPIDTAIDPQVYRGQDFILRSRVDWQALTVQDWFKWIMIRSIQPVEVENCILWARWDLFPGYTPSTVIIQ